MCAVFVVMCACPPCEVAQSTEDECCAVCTNTSMSYTVNSVWWSFCISFVYFTRLWNFEAIRVVVYW